MDITLGLFLVAALRKELVTVQVFLRLCQEGADLETLAREGCGILGIDWLHLTAAERSLCLTAAEQARMEVT